MKWAYPGGTFKYGKEYPILTEQGTALTQSGNYSITDYDYVECTKVDAFTLDFSEAESFDFAIGDDIRIRQNGFEYLNRVATVDTEGQRIKLTSPLKQGTPTSLDVKKDFYLYAIDEDCDEGFYRFKNGEVILIRSYFQSVIVSYSDFISRNRSISTMFEAADYEAYWQSALDAVSADFSYLGNFWDVLDLNQIKELVLRKVLALIEIANSDKVQFQNDYDKFKTSVVNIASVNPETESSDVALSAKSTYNLVLGG